VELDEVLTSGGDKQKRRSQLLRSPFEILNIAAD
jgi:hypothetical protein